MFFICWVLFHLFSHVLIFYSFNSCFLILGFEEQKQPLNRSLLYLFLYRTSSLIPVRFLNHLVLFDSLFLQCLPSPPFPTFILGSWRWKAHAPLLSWDLFTCMCSNKAEAESHQRASTHTRTHRPQPVKPDLRTERPGRGCDWHNHSQVSVAEADQRDGVCSDSTRPHTLPVGAMFKGNSHVWWHFAWIRGDLRREEKTSAGRALTLAR